MITRPPRSVVAVGRPRGRVKVELVEGQICLALKQSHFAFSALQPLHYLLVIVVVLNSAVTSF